MGACLRWSHTLERVPVGGRPAARVEVPSRARPLPGLKIVASYPCSIPQRSSLELTTATRRVARHAHSRSRGHQASTVCQSCQASSMSAASASSPRSSSRYDLFDGLHLEQASDLFLHAPGGGQFVGQRRQFTDPIAGSVFCSSAPPRVAASGDSSAMADGAGGGAARRA